MGTHTHASTHTLHYPLILHTHQVFRSTAYVYIYVLVGYSTPNFFLLRTPRQNPQNIFHKGLRELVLIEESNLK